MTGLQGQARRGAAWYRGVADGWNLEVGSAIFSLLCMVATVAVLLGLQDTPLSSWSLFISPNAVISVLSTASKVAFIFPISEGLSQLKWLHLANSGKLEDLQVYDSASRGPLGALRFYWSARASPFISYIICVIIASVLAVEPFSQQILRFEQRETLDPYTRSIVLKSTVYDHGSEGVTGVSGRIAAPRDNPMKAAIFNGLYGVVQPPPFSCPSSNCDYPPFTTLGVCNTCEDVTNASTTRQLAPSNSSFDLFEVQTPGGLSLQARSSFSAHHGFTHTLVNTTLRGTGRSTEELPVSVGIVQIPYDESPEINSRGNWIKTMKAYECSIAFCARRYQNWTVVNGTLNAGQQDTSELVTNGNDFGMISWLPTAPARVGGDDDDTAFQINRLDNSNMYMLLSSIFGQVPDPRTYQFSDALVAASATTNAAAAAGHGEGIPAAIANITLGMTHRIMAGPNATRARGSVYRAETYITVRWAWLAFPAALVVLSCGCLASVIRSTRRARQAVWKSSLTPLLLAGDSDSPVVGEAEVEDEKPVWTTTGQRGVRTRTIASHLRE